MLQKIENSIEFYRMLEQAKPKAISFQVNPAARVVLDEMKEITGVPNSTALERICEWFASLDPKIRTAILNRDVDTRRALLSGVIEDMKRPDWPQAIPWPIKPPLKKAARKHDRPPAPPNQ